MPLAENTVRDIASRYGGGDAPEQRAAEESPALRHAGAAIEAVLRGDPAAFLEAIQLMMDPVAPLERRDDEPAAADDDFDPDLIPPEV